VCNMQDTPDFASGYPCINRRLMSICGSKKIRRWLHKDFFSLGTIYYNLQVKQ